MYGLNSFCASYFKTNCGIALYNPDNLQVNKTALILAAERGRDDCVRVLLEARANTEAKDKVRLIFYV